MLRSLILKNFRQFKRLEIGGFERLNLLTGDNHTGKTTVLEGAFWLHCAHHPALILNLIAMRQGPVDFARPGEDLFHGSDAGTPFVVSGSVADQQVEVQVSAKASGLVPQIKSDSGNGKESLPSRPGVVTSSNISGAFGLLARITRNGTELGETPIQFLSHGANSQTYPVNLPSCILFTDTHADGPAHAARLSQVFRQGGADRFLHTVQVIDPRIRKVEILSIGGDPVVFVQSDPHTTSLPLSAFGGGLRRLVSVAAAVFSLRGGTILFDEIENGIHYQKLGQYFEKLLAIAEQNDVQIIATTHSADAVRAAVGAASTSLGPSVRVFRLVRETDGHSVESYAPDEITTAINLGLPIR